MTIARVNEVCHQVCRCHLEDVASRRHLVLEVHLVHFPRSRLLVYPPAQLRQDLVVAFQDPLVDPRVHSLVVLYLSNKEVLHHVE